MAHHHAADLARDLARQAEAVCRHYLPAGRRQGRYWIVGDVHNAQGRSLFVGLSGPASGKGAAGKWQDAATAQHGDLLDLIRLRCGYVQFTDAADEGRRFLGLPAHGPPRTPIEPIGSGRSGDPVRSTRAAQRLFAGGHAIGGTLAARYLYQRGIVLPDDRRWLRFHPRCFCRPEAPGSAEARPAIVAAVTDLSGTITGVHRTFLARDGQDKAPLASPRRALGMLHGHAARFGTAHDIMLVGEGLETVLSLSTILPAMPAAAALSAANLAAVLLPTTLRRLYIAEDNDAAGRHATAAVIARAHGTGIEPIVLRPRLNDFNDDLRAFGPDILRSTLCIQLAPEDVPRFKAR